MHNAHLFKTPAQELVTPTCASEFLHASWALGFCDNISVGMYGHHYSHVIFEQHEAQNRDRNVLKSHNQQNAELGPHPRASPPCSLAPCPPGQEASSRKL